MTDSRPAQGPQLGGKTSLREVKRKLADMGLSLGMDLDAAQVQAAVMMADDDDDEVEEPKLKPAARR